MRDSYRTIKSERKNTKRTFLHSANKIPLFNVNNAQLPTIFNNYLTVVNFFRFISFTTKIKAAQPKTLRYFILLVRVFVVDGANNGAVVDYRMGVLSCY